MTFKIGLIGCSSVSKKNIIPAVNSLDFATISAVGSRSVEKARLWSKEIGCNVYGNYQDVIASDVDCVYISLPNALHEEWVIKAAEAGKHILCEKSSTTSYESAKKMIDSCKSANVRILECFSFRFHPQHRTILELIKNNTLGNIYCFIGKFGYPKPESDNIRWKKDLGGGILNDACCYPICASRIIFNEEPIGVMANLTNDPMYGIDTAASVFLTFEKKNAYAESGFNRSFQSTYEVWGSKGSIISNRAYAVPKNFETVVTLTQNDKTETIETKSFDQTSMMLTAFYREVLGQKESPFDFEEDLLSQAKVMEAARKSSNKTKFVYLDEIT
jgi:predicted dehydrogenase